MVKKLANQLTFERSRNGDDSGYRAVRALSSMENPWAGALKNVGNVFDRIEKRGVRDRLEEEKGATRKALSEADFVKVLGGSGGGGGSGASAKGGGGYEGIVSSLVGTEANQSDPWGSRNDVVGAGGKKGHFGRLQFGQSRLQDFKNATGTDFTSEEFLKNPELQQKVEQWHFGDIDTYIADNHLAQFIGENVSGEPLTMNGMRAVAHLGGKEGLNRYLTSGGRYNPKDAFGTHLSDYARTHAGSGSGGSTGSGGGGRMGIDLDAANDFIRESIASGANPEVVMSYVKQMSGLSKNDLDRRETISKMGLRPSQEQRKEAELEIRRDQEERMERGSESTIRARDRDIFEEEWLRGQKRELLGLDNQFKEGVNTLVEGRINEERAKGVEINPDVLQRLRLEAQREYGASEEGRGLLNQMNRYPQELYQTTGPGGMERRERDISDYQAKREGNQSKEGKGRKYNPQRITGDGQFMSGRDSKYQDKLKSERGARSWVDRVEGIRDLGDDDRKELARRISGLFTSNSHVSTPMIEKLVNRSLTRSINPLKGFSNVIDWDIFSSNLDELDIITKQMYDELSK